MRCFHLQVALYTGEPSPVEISGIRGKSFEDHSKRPSASKHQRQHIKFGGVAYVHYPGCVARTLETIRIHPDST